MKKKLVLAAVVAMLAAAAWAVPVERWVQTTSSDFDAGDAQGVSVLTLGQLVLAPELKPLLKDPVPHVWALAADPKGTLYAATGTEPRVLRISGGKAEPFFTSPEKTDLAILAVAVAPDGAVYAAAAPSGVLYRIAPDGKAEAYYKADGPYIWALAVAPNGAVYAGTGPEGKVLRIAGKDKADTLLKAGSRHILSLALAADGSVYAGSDRDGFLYHVSAKGESRVAYDAEGDDIRALAFDAQGRLYFATAGASRGAAAASTATPSTAARTFTMSGHGNPSDTGSGGDALAGQTPPPSGATAAPSAKPSGGNAIYRLMPSGDVARVASVAGAAFYSLLWHNGRLYAGTGNDGKLYCVEGTQVARVANLDGSQITALLAVEGRLLAATANSGQVYQVAADHVAQGTLVSKVQDTESHSRWGTASWDARTPKGTSVTLATRTGNTATPDETWSPWSDELTRAEGDRITSPSARFIQYRATLKTSRPADTPVLDEVILSYAQNNRRPTFSQVQIQTAPKPRRMMPMPTPQPGQMGMQPPMPVQPAPSQSSKAQTPPSPRGPFAETIRISWQATDPNKDDLVFAVYFRGEDERTWKKLQDKLSAAYYDWDTHAVPDGLYRIRVVASDSPTNPPGEAEEGEKITEAFLVDNTPPTVAGLAIRIAKDKSLTVTAKCSDAGTGLAEGEYSIDGGDWTSIAPADGIFDSQGEALDFKVPALEKGEHTLVVRVKDQAENSGAAKVVFTVD
ncbi:MAG TPA: hypothetical protein PLE19_11690 [Planctomycetota bacterium]|nr:hypothetical protein [Planctomycetota bacterium]HRR78737.1 hypothetical protein [Planctomycetota bacterium]HRT95679.1 hypothetical protein [Planctomycetota bacterium]